MYHYIGMIIKRLELRRPIFRKTAAYGHFGRSDPDFIWEKIVDMKQWIKQPNYQFNSPIIAFNFWF